MDGGEGLIDFCRAWREGDGLRSLRAAAIFIAALRQCRETLFVFTRISTSLMVARACAKAGSTTSALLQRLKGDQREGSLAQSLYRDVENLLFDTGYA